MGRNLLSVFLFTAAVIRNGYDITAIENVTKRRRMMLPAMTTEETMFISWLQLKRSFLTCLKSLTCLMMSKFELAF